jgi:hypothetical protein
MIERSRAGCRFFQRLTHRFGADRIDQTQDDHFVGEQLQGPVTSPEKLGALIEEGTFRRPKSTAQRFVCLE